MEKVALVARVAFEFEGRALAAGDRFEAAPVEAAKVLHARKAQYATGAAVSRRDMVPEGRTAEASRDRRRSRRRDLTPEG